jgi:hypothetical protein
MMNSDFRDYIIKAGSEKIANIVYEDLDDRI